MTKTVMVAVVEPSSLIRLNSARSSPTQTIQSALLKWCKSGCSSGFTQTIHLTTILQICIHDRRPQILHIDVECTSKLKNRVITQYEQILSAIQFYRVQRENLSVLGFVLTWSLLQEFIKHPEVYGLDIRSRSCDLIPRAPWLALLNTRKHKEYVRKYLARLTHLNGIKVKIKDMQGLFVDESELR